MRYCVPLHAIVLACCANAKWGMLRLQTCCVCKMGSLVVTMFANETELFADVRCMQTWEAVEKHVCRQQRLVCRSDSCICKRYTCTACLQTRCAHLQTGPTCLQMSSREVVFVNKTHRLQMNSVCLQTCAGHVPFANVAPCLQTRTVRKLVLTYIFY